MLGAVWFALLGTFMLGAGHYAVRQTESWAILEGQSVADFMDRDFISVSPDLTLEDFVNSYVYKYYQQSFPVVDDKKLMGIIDVQSIMTLDRKRWGWSHVRSHMQTVENLNVVPSDMPAADALDLMKRSGLQTILIIHGQKLVGILYLKSIMDYLSVIGKLNMKEKQGI